MYNTGAPPPFNSTIRLIGPTQYDFIGVKIGDIRNLELTCGTATLNKTTLSFPTLHKVKVQLLPIKRKEAVVLRPILIKYICYRIIPNLAYTFSGTT
ncbi:MAG: hypothetical protein IPL56_15830 [Saprospiraceae bacterium]|nr:hypothetical protein [Saprospiraceae bacterium]